MSRTILSTLALALAACATPPPFEQREWLAVRTAHYDILSAIGDAEAVRLAAELERFRDAVEYVWGSALPVEPMRTRVYAFDDRELPRKFAYQYQRSYLLARQRGDVIVLRTGGGWQDAWTEQKLQYARRLLWNASAEESPPWLDEGLPQLASTIESGSDGALVGTVRDDHLQTLRENAWIPFSRLLASTDLVGWSDRERETLEAEAWALCHYLWFGASQRDAVSERVARFRDLLREGASPAEAASATVDDSLQGRVYRHVIRNEFAAADLDLPLRGGAPALSAIPKAAVLTELGTLSLAIGEIAQGRRYLERALEQQPGSAHILAGLGDALAAERDFAGAEQRYREALAADPDGALARLGLANLLAAQASDSSDAARRAELVREAREHYEQSRALAGALPEADAGLAATYLLAGEELAQGREHLRAARAALPGDLELAHLDVRFALAAGDSAAARHIAALLLTRARSASELESARALLDQIEVRAAAVPALDR